MHTSSLSVDAQMLSSVLRAQFDVNSYKLLPPFGLEHAQLHA